MRYYKVRNGNGAFEYEIVKKMTKIELKLEDNESDFFCCVISAIIANVISNLECIKGSNSKSVVFILGLGTLYFVIKQLIIILKRVKRNIIEKIIKKDVNEREEKEVIDFFYNKAVNDTVFIISLVNRVTDLKKHNYKNELCKLYLFQAQNSLQNLAEQMNKHIFFNNQYRLKTVISSIGTEQIVYVLEQCKYYAEDIQRLDNEINMKAVITYFSNSIELIKEKMPV